MTRIGKWRLLVVAGISLVLVGCAGTTKIKYIQHQASSQLKLANGTVITAPSGQHFMLYLVNCIDNSTRDEGFFFTSQRIRDYQNQYSVVSDLPQLAKIVSAGDTATDIGQLVFVLPGPPEKYLSNLFYDSHESESVLMINQTTSGPDFGASYIIVDQIDLVNATQTPFLDQSNLCADKGSFH